MLDRLRNLGVFSHDSEEDETDASSGKMFTALRIFSAQLLLSTGANATLHYLRTRSAPQPAATGYDRGLESNPLRHEPRVPAAAAWVPLLVGAAASAVQTSHVLQPSERSDLASKVLNGVVLGLGLVGAVDKAAAAARGEEPFSVAPLLFGYAGLIGFLLDRQEGLSAEEEAELKRRASIVERFVPRRRTKIERVVVHV